MTRSARGVAFEWLSFAFMGRSAALAYEAMEALPRRGISALPSSKHYRFWRSDCFIN
jgi:hypothetical protein